jgi:hypothetical protein
MEIGWMELLSLVHSEIKISLKHTNLKKKKKRKRKRKRREGFHKFPE